MSLDRGRSAAIKCEVYDEGRPVMIELAEKIQVECFLCKRILEKMKADIALSEAESYHISVDLEAIKTLRQNTIPVATC